MIPWLVLTFFLSIRTAALWSYIFSVLCFKFTKTHRWKFFFNLKQSLKVNFSFWKLKVYMSVYPGWVCACMTQSKAAILQSVDMLLGAMSAHILYWNSPWLFSQVCWVQFFDSIYDGELTVTTWCQQVARQNYLPLAKNKQCVTTIVWTDKTLVSQSLGFVWRRCWTFFSHWPLNL